MAGPCAYRSPCGNLFPTTKDKLTRAALTEGSGTVTPTPVVFRALTSALAIAPVIAPSLNNKLFKQFIKTYLETQVPKQTKVDPKPRKQPFKAQFPNLYYGSLDMDYYQFCQQCKDHFKTAGAKGPNKILFKALFLHALVTQQWLKYKRRCDGAVAMTWVKFKDFFWKNLGNFEAFVDSIWKKVKRNS